MMNEALIVGTRGWEYPAGGPGFYPPELPEDWRFSYYSNLLRGVLFPQSVWPAATRATVDQWLDDSYPESRYVLELPDAFGMLRAGDSPAASLTAFLDLIEPLMPRVAGFLLRMEASSTVVVDEFEHLLNRLVDIVPLCVDLPSGAWRADPVLEALARQGAGRCWHCAREPAPAPGGRLLVALSPPGTPRESRRCIEQIAHWQQPGARAGYFIEAAAGAGKAAQEARLIAELMGV